MEPPFPVSQLSRMHEINANTPNTAQEKQREPYAD